MRISNSEPTHKAIKCKIGIIFLRNVIFGKVLSLEIKKYIKKVFIMDYIQVVYRIS